MSEVFNLFLKRFFKEVGLVRYQIESYNDFITRRIPKVLQEIGEIKPEVAELGDFKIKLGEFRIGNPSIKEADGSVRPIYPREARIRNLTYAAPMFVEMTPILNNIESESAMVNFGDMPVMVKSKICPLSSMTEKELIKAGEDPNDPGGYFIVNGTERILVLVEEIAPNRIIVEKVDSGNISEIARIHSEKSGYVIRHLVERKNDGIITISFANITRIPIITILKALGLESDKDILLAISDFEEIRQEFFVNLFESEASKRDEALDEIGKFLKIPQKEYRIDRALKLIDKYLLPHLGQSPSNRMEKALFLAKVIEKIIKLHLGKIEEDDLDHYSNKRLRLSGDLLEILLRSILLGKWGLITKITWNYQRLTRRGRIPPLQAIVESNVLTNQIISALAIGMWVGGRSGVSQRLERANWIKTITHMRNVLSPLTSTQEHFEARELHPTHFGKLCVSETPEGATIGLRKYLAILANVTYGISEKEYKNILKMIPKSDEGSLIFFDGRFVGKTKEPERLVEEIRRLRREGKIPYQLNIAYHKNLNEVRILGDSGRIIRPLIIVEDGKPKLTKEIIEKFKKGEIGWFDLVKNGIIEYLDAEEEENALIALKESELKKEHTHLEIDPAVIFGFSASFLPFPEFNRGDRVNIGARMVGQAIGVYSTNYLTRVDTKSNVQIYNQTPLVQTFLHEATNFQKHPNGLNVVIAIASFEGYNSWDAIVFNKASVQRGLFWSYMYRTYEAEQKMYMGGQEDTIGIPDPGVRGYAGEDAYKHLDEDGIVNPETYIGSDQVLVGRVSPLRFLGTMDQFITGIENIRETSIRTRHATEGIVDRVFITETVDGTKLVKVVVRDLKIPEIGDKFATRHGQKGVIGLLVPHSDMPFTKSGIVPDIIFNPHAIPARMTVGQLLEIVAGKVAALKGEPIKISAFNSISEEELRRELEKYGFEYAGTEEMYDGKTGKKFEAKIFIGCCFYQKLDHLVSNKIHARSRGPVTLLTKQPTEGRSKEGGLRLGEMEKDCLIAHGAALVLKERFDADKTKIPVCIKCGLVAIRDRIKNKMYCSICEDSKIVEVEISYAFKLMLDELKSMMIYPKIRVGE